MIRIVMLFLVGTIAGLAIVIKYLPWWAILLGVVGLIFVGKFVIKRLFFRLLLKPFQLKGAVLKGATAEVHSVTPLVEPPLKGSTTAERLRYAVEVTIRPAASNTPFGAWEPGELRLVSPESVLNVSPDAPSDNYDACE